MQRTHFFSNHKTPTMTYKQEEEEENASPVLL